jgi:hypothetical protein
VRVWESLTRDVIIVDEGLSSAASLMSYFPFPGGSNFFGNMNAGIGWGLAAAADVQIALLIFNVFLFATVALACLYAVLSQRVT